MYPESSKMTANEPQSAQAGELKSFPAELVFLVHGTFAGRVSEKQDEGWWEKESPFTKALTTAVSALSANTAIKCQSLPWDLIGLGANSEAIRRASSRELLRQLREFDDAGT